MKIGLTFQTFLLMAICAVIIGTAAIFILQKVAYDRERDKLSVEIATASVRLSKPMYSFLQEKKTSSLEPLISAFAGTPEVKCVVLSSKKIEDEMYWPVPFCAEDNPGLLLHSQPIRRSLRAIGKVDVYFSDASILKNIRQTTWSIGLGIGLLLSTMLIVLLIVQRSMVGRPINIIIDSFTRLSKGELDFRINNIKNIPEFISISNAFNNMAEELQKKSKELERANHELGRYFSPSIRERILNSVNEKNIDQKSKQNVAILFTDIVGFTTISESMEPDKVVEMLSEYQKRIVAIIFSNSGSVDKFIGDAVMATFGTPSSNNDDLKNAYNCCLEMKNAMIKWNQEREKLKLPPIAHKIGLHYGECVVGAIGTEQKKEFTVIGDTVNVASRVCEFAKKSGGSCLITDAVVSNLGITDISFIGDVSVKGKTKKLKLYKVY